VAIILLGRSGARKSALEFCCSVLEFEYISQNLSWIWIWDSISLVSYEHSFLRI
jgi:hypothetical protein